MKPVLPTNKQTEPKSLSHTTLKPRDTDSSKMFDSMLVQMRGAGLNLVTLEVLER